MDVATDQTDYEVDDVARITASGFAVGDSVEFQMHTADDGLALTDPYPVTDGSSSDLDGVANGSIQLDWTISEAGVPLQVLATASSGETGSTAFNVAAEEVLPPQVTITTDKSDYLPSDTAIIAASGFLPGETVEFQVLHVDDTPNTGEGHESWLVTDGGPSDADGVVDGSIQTSWFVSPDDSLNSVFSVTAYGHSSGNVGEAQFTDGYWATRFYDPFNSGASSSYWVTRDVESYSGYVKFDANNDLLQSTNYSFSSSYYTDIRVTYSLRIPAQSNLPESNDSFDVEYYGSDGQWHTIFNNAIYNTSVGSSWTNRTHYLSRSQHPLAFHSGFRLRFDSLDSDPESYSCGSWGTSTCYDYEVEEWDLNYARVEGYYAQPPNVTSSKAFSGSSFPDDYTSSLRFSYSMSRGDSNIRSRYSSILRNGGTVPGRYSSYYYGSPGVSSVSGNLYVYPATDGPGTYQLYSYAYDQQSDYAIDYSPSVTIYDDDPTGPVITFGNDINQLDNQSNFVTWSATDNESGISSRYARAERYSGGTWSPVTGYTSLSSINLDAMEPGTYRIHAYAYNNDTDGGRTSDREYTSSYSDTFTISDEDSAGPSVVLGGSSGTQSTLDNQVFTWNVSDTQSGVSSVIVSVTRDAGSGPVAIFGPASVSAVGSFDFNSYGEGTYAISVSATDGDTDWGPGDRSTTGPVTRTAVADAPPEVVDVLAHWGSTSHSILGLDVLPWLNVDAIEVVFSEDVSGTLDITDLSLVGGTSGAVSFSGFSYNPTANSATWEMSPLAIDDFMLELGSAGVSDSAGLGLAGGDYGLNFAALPGDYNQDRVVNSLDMVGVRNQLPAYGGSSSPLADIDGDGDVDTTDYLLVRSRIGTRLS